MTPELITRVRRTTDSENILSNVCKLLIRLGEKILRTTDETCFLCAGHAIMRATMLQLLSISGIFRAVSSISCRYLPGTADVGLSASGANPMEIPSVAVGLSHVDPIVIVGYPTEIPCVGWDFRWDLMGSRLVSPLDHGITSKWKF